MRAWEFLTEHERVPPITLRRVNDAKKEVFARDLADEERMNVVSVMYRDLDRDKEGIEAEKMRLDLEQQRLELKRLRAEVGEPESSPDYGNPDRIKKLARAEVDRRRNSRRQLSDIAVTALRNQQE